jgi:hypothetical protein
MKTLLAFILVACSGMAAAQRYTCEVDMVDIRTNRVLQTFRIPGVADCFESKKACAKERRLSGRLNTADCVEYTRRPNNGNGNGGYRPDPRQIQIDSFLRMSNYQLAQEAQYGIGACRVARGSYNSSCTYYVNVNGRGYPYGGSGCAQSNYTYQYGCSERTEQENAGCMIRRAISQGECL